MDCAWQGENSGVVCDSRQIVSRKYIIYTKIYRCYNDCGEKPTRLPMGESCLCNGEKLNLEVKTGGMIMKQGLIFLLAAFVLVGSLTGCTGTTVVYQTDCPYHTESENVAVKPSTDTSVEADTETDTEETTTVTQGALKTGLAVVTSVAKSENATQADYDVTQVAVLVDEAGVIQDCKIDGIATQVAFDATGTITSDVTAEVQTKNELGENYGMTAYGGAIAEWDEQVEALAQFAIGKTVEELKNGAIDESGKAPEGSDLASSATIYLGGYVAAIEKAVANAKHLGAQAGDELRLACMNTVDSSANASEEAEGTAQLDSTVTALTVEEGVITSCYIDSVQAKVNFDRTGTITSDVTAEVQTKNELGENYGMAAYGNAIAEWDAQAAAFAEYVTGKTAEEVADIAVNEKTAPTEADLSSSVTIAIGGFQSLIHKALQQ